MTGGSELPGRGSTDATGGAGDQNRWRGRVVGQTGATATGAGAELNKTLRADAGVLGARLKEAAHAAELGVALIHQLALA